MFNLQSRHKIAFSNVTREIIGKMNMQELWFFCMTCRLNVLYKGMKFVLIPLTGIKLYSRHEIALEMVKGK